MVEDVHGFRPHDERISHRLDESTSAYSYCIRLLVHYSSLIPIPASKSEQDGAADSRHIHFALHTVERLDFNELKRTVYPCRGSRHVFHPCMACMED